MHNETAQAVINIIVNASGSQQGVNQHGAAMQLIVRQSQNAAKESALSFSSIFGAQFFADLVAGWVRSIISGGQQMIREAVRISAQFESAFAGLRGIGRNLGLNPEDVIDAVKGLDLVKSGLLTVNDAATSVKNLLATGFSLDQAIELVKRFADTAAFGRQASLSFGYAIASATEGVKNQNSILVDNAGVTKNLSVILAEQGFIIQDLSDKQKGAAARQALYNGLIKETAIQQGDANKLLDTAQGRFVQLESAQIRASKSLGDFITKSETVNAVLSLLIKILDIAGANINSVLALAAAFGVLTVAIIAMNSAQLGALPIISQMISSFSLMGKVMVGTAGLAAGATATLLLQIAAWGAIAIAVGAVVYALYSYNQQQTKVEEASAATVDSLIAQQTVLMKQSDELGRAADESVALADRQAALQSVYAALNTTSQARVAGIDDEIERTRLLQAEIRRLLALKSEELQVNARIIAQGLVQSLRDEAQREQQIARALLEQKQLQGIEQRITTRGSAFLTQQELEGSVFLRDIQSLGASEQLAHVQRRIAALDGSIGSLRTAAEGFNQASRSQLERLQKLAPALGTTTEALVQQAFEYHLLNGNQQQAIALVNAFAAAQVAATKDTKTATEALREQIAEIDKMGTAERQSARRKLLSSELTQIAEEAPDAQSAKRALDERRKNNAEFDKLVKDEERVRGNLKALEDDGARAAEDAAKRIEQAAQLQLTALEGREERIQALREQGKIDAFEELALQESLSRQRHAIERKSLTDQLTMMGAFPDRVATINNELKELDIERTNEVQREANRRLEILREEGEKTLALRNQELDTGLRLVQINNQHVSEVAGRNARERITNAETAAEAIAAAELGTLYAQRGALEQKLHNTQRYVADERERASQVTDLQQELQVVEAEINAARARSLRTVTDARLDDIETARQQRNEVFQLDRDISQQSRELTQQRIDLLEARGMSPRDARTLRIAADAEDELLRTQLARQQLRLDAERDMIGKSVAERQQIGERYYRLAELEEERHQLNMAEIRNSALEDYNLALGQILDNQVLNEQEAQTKIAQFIAAQKGVTDIVADAKIGVIKTTYDLIDRGLDRITAKLGIMQGLVKQILGDFLRLLANRYFTQLFLGSGAPQTNTGGGGGFNLLSAATQGILQPGGGGAGVALTPGFAGGPGGGQFFSGASGVGLSALARQFTQQQRGGIGFLPTITQQTQSAAQVNSLVQAAQRGAGGAAAGVGAATSGASLATSLGAMAPLLGLSLGVGLGGGSRAGQILGGAGGLLAGFIGTSILAPGVIASLPGMAGFAGLTALGLGILAPAAAALIVGAILLARNQRRRREEEERSRILLDAKSQIDQIIAQVKSGRLDGTTAIAQAMAIRQNYLNQVSQLRDSKTRNIALATVRELDYQINILKQTAAASDRAREVERIIVPTFRHGGDVARFAAGGGSYRTSMGGPSYYDYIPALLAGDETVITSAVRAALGGERRMQQLNVRGYNDGSSPRSRRAQSAGAERPIIIQPILVADDKTADELVKNAGADAVVQKVRLHVKKTGQSGLAGDIIETFVAS